MLNSNFFQLQKKLHYPTILIFFILIIAILLSHCNKQDWYAYNDADSQVMNICDRQNNADQKNIIRSLFVPNANQGHTINNQKIPDVYDPIDYPGFNPVIKWDSSMNTQDRENIKLAIIKTKIIVNLDLFDIAVINRNRLYPLKATYFLRDPLDITGRRKHPKTPILPTESSQLIKKIRDFKYPVYTQYVNTKIENSTLIGKSQSTTYPPKNKNRHAVASAGYQTMAFHYAGAIIRCKNGTPFVLLHEFIHIMDYAHDYSKIPKTYDVAVVLGEIARAIYYAIKIPKIPKSCYQGPSTNYDCS